MSKELGKEIEKKENKALEKKKVDPFRSLIGKLENEIKKALPQHINVDHFARVLLTEIKNNPDIQKCTPISIMSSVMLAAQLGLEVGGSLGQCYLIPFNNRNTGTKECQFQIGYKGLMQLCYNSGKVAYIMPYVAYVEDKTEIVRGNDEDYFKIYPNEDGPREKGRIFFAKAELTTGGKPWDFMTRNQVERHRDRFSPSWNKGRSPWKTDFEPMAMKTILKRLCNYLPLSIEDMAKVNQDGKIKNSIAEDMFDEQENEDAAIIEAEAQTVEAEQPQTEPEPANAAS